MTTRRRRLGAALVRLACIPPDVAGAVIVVVAYRLWGLGGSFGVRDGVLTAELRPDAWLSRAWEGRRAGIVVGHAIVFAAGHARERLWKHEKVHVDQCEAAQCSSALAAVLLLAIGAPLAALLVWSMGSLLMSLGGKAAALLRGGDAFFDNVHERAALTLEGSGSGEAEDVTRRSRRPALRA